MRDCPGNVVMIQEHMDGNSWVITRKTKPQTERIKLNLSKNACANYEIMMYKLNETWAIYRQHKKMYSVY